MSHSVLQLKQDFRDQYIKGLPYCGIKDTANAVKKKFAVSCKMLII